MCSSDLNRIRGGNPGRGPAQDEDSDRCGHEATRRQRHRGRSRAAGARLPGQFICVLHIASQRCTDYASERRTPAKTRAKAAPVGVLRLGQEAVAPAGPAPPMQHNLEQAELIGQQALVTAGTIIPVAPIHPALIAPENPRLGQPCAKT